MTGDESTTCLVTHVIGSKQPEVGFSSMFCIATTKVVKLGTVCKGIIAVLLCKSEDIDIIGPAGSFSGVRKEELGATSKEDINNWSERSFADKVFCNDRLVVAVVYVGGKGCRCCMLAKVLTDTNMLITQTDRNSGCDNKAGMVSCGFCGLEDSPARISVLVDTNCTIVSLGTQSEKQIRLESAELGTLIAQE